MVFLEPILNGGHYTKKLKISQELYIINRYIFSIFKLNTLYMYLNYLNLTIFPNFREFFLLLEHHAKCLFFMDLIKASHLA